MELICFDMDNTLVYAQKLHVYAFHEAFKTCNLPKRKTKDILEVLSLEGSVLVKILYPKLSEKEIKKVVDEHDRFVVKNAKHYITRIPGAVPMLQKLKKRYKLALLSNAKKKEIVATLQAAKISPKLFDVIIGNDAVKHPKPAPDEMFKAQKLLNIRKGYMVGDATYDIRAGKQAGLKTIAVCTGHHTKKELQKEKPYKILKSVAELSKVL